MNLEQLIGRLKKTPSFMENVTHWETIPAKEASFAPFPAELDNRLPPVLAQRGVYKLYSHQREAFDLAATGKDICVVTPTASGKTMCYNLPGAQRDSQKQRCEGALPLSDKSAFGRPGFRTV